MVFFTKIKQLENASTSVSGRQLIWRG